MTDGQPSRTQSSTNFDSKSPRVSSVDATSFASYRPGMGKSNTFTPKRPVPYPRGKPSESKRSVSGRMRKKSVGSTRNPAPKEPQFDESESEKALRDREEPLESLDMGMSPYMGQKQFQIVDPNVAAMSRLEFKDKYLFQITYPTPFSYEIYAYSRRGVLLGAQNGTPYIHAECGISSDESTGKAFNGQGLFGFVLGTSNLGNEILELFKPTCLNIWGSEINKAKCSVVGMGVNAAKIYEKDLVYSFFPHLMYSNAFIFNARKKETHKTSVAALSNHSGSSFFNIRLAVKMFQFEYVPSTKELFLKGFINVKALTLIDRGQDKTPPEELPERKSQLDKEINVEVTDKLPLIPMIPEELDVADDGAKNFLESLRSGFTPLQALPAPKKRKADELTSTKEKSKIIEVEE